MIIFNLKGIQIFAMEQQLIKMKVTSQQIKCAWQSNQFDLERWEPFLDQSNIFFNKMNNDQIQYKTIRIFQDQAEQYKKYLNIRANINHPYVCKLIFSSDTTLPTHKISGFNDFTIFTERTLQLIDSNWNLQMFSIVLKTLIYLSSIYGPFQFTQNMAFQNQKRQLKLWISEDPYENIPDLPLSSLKQANQCFISLISAKNTYIADNLKGSKSYQESYIRLNNIKYVNQTDVANHKLLKQTSSTSFSKQSIVPKLIRYDQTNKKIMYYPVNNYKKEYYQRSSNNGMQEQNKYLINNTSVSRYTVTHEKQLSNINEDLQKEEIQQSQWQYRDNQCFKKKKINQNISRPNTTKQQIHTSKSKEKIKSKIKTFKFYNPQISKLCFPTSSLKMQNSHPFPSKESSANQTLRQQKEAQYKINNSLGKYSHSITLKKIGSKSPSIKEDKQKNVPLFIKQRQTKLIQNQRSFYKTLKYDKLTSRKLFNQTSQQFSNKRNDEFSPKKSHQKYNEILSKGIKSSSSFNLQYKVHTTDRVKTNLFTSNIQKSIITSPLTKYMLQQPERTKAITYHSKSFTSNFFKKSQTMNKQLAKNAVQKCQSYQHPIYKQKTHTKMIDNSIFEKELVPLLNLTQLKTNKTVKKQQEKNAINRFIERQIQMTKSIAIEQPKYQKQEPNMKKKLQIQISSILGFQMDSQQQPQSNLKQTSPYQKQQKNNKLQIERIKQKIVLKQKQFAQLKKQASALL